MADDRFEANLFAEVGQLVRALAPEGCGETYVRSHRRGVKVWFDSADPTREHYEAQLMPARYLEDGDAVEGVVLEVGFHAENADEQLNQAVADRFKKQQKVWRKELGKPAVLDNFYGRESWRRLSEVWTEIEGLDEDPDAAFEIASRLVDYVTVLEPIRQGG